MKNKILSFVFSFFAIILCAGLFVACGSTPREIRITQTLPTNVWMEFSYNGRLCKVVKTGDYYYCYHNEYSPYEVFVQENMSLQFEEEEQHYRAYSYNGTQWNIINSWSVNRQYRNEKLQDALSLTRTGYSSINADFDGKDYVLKPNETLIVDGHNIECVVYECVSNSGVYSKEKYWYEKDSKILIQYCQVFDAEANINAESSRKYITYKFLTEGFAMKGAIESFGDNVTGLPPAAVPEV